MKKTLLTTLAIAALVAGARASTIQSVQVTGDTGGAVFPISGLSGTFKSGDFVSYAYTVGGGAFTNANQTVPLFGNLAPAQSDRRQQYVGFATAATQPTQNPTLGSTNAELNAANIPSYLLGYEYIMTMNDNRSFSDFGLHVELNEAGRRAYLFVDTRYGDGSDQSGPTLTDPALPMTIWLASGGWAPMITGAKPSDYLGVGDVIGINSAPRVATGPNATTNLKLNQYSEIWYKDIVGTSFDTGAFGQSYNIYGIVIGVVPEPSSAALLCAAGALMLIRRKRA